MNYVTSVGVQQFSITIASGSTTGTATITAVGSGAFIVWGGSNSSATTNAAEALAYITLTNPTTITATRNTGTTGTVTVTGCIIDGDTINLIKSVQYSTISIGATSTSGTASISAVTNANTAIHMLGYKDASTSFNALYSTVDISLSGTTVTATRASQNNNAITVSFVAIEFQSSALNQSVQNVSVALSSTNTTATASITAVNTSNAITFYGGQSASVGSTSLNELIAYGQLTATTTFTTTRNTSISGPVLTYKASIVEFVSGVLNSAVQRGIATLTGVTSNTNSLSSINEAYSGVSWLGNKYSAANADLNRALGAISLGTSSGISVLQTKFGTASGGHATLTTTLAGSLIVAVISTASGSGTVSGVTDSAGQTYTQATNGYANDTINGTSIDVWYFANSVAGVTTVTPTYSGGTDNGFAVYEVQGAALTSPIDATGSPLNSQAATLNPISPAITTAISGDFIIVTLSTASDATAISSPWTLDTNNGISAYYIPSGTVSSQTATFTQAANEHYGSSIVAFAPATSFQSVTITKNTATANITGSWEVFEFPAYIAPGGGISLAWYTC